MSRPSNRHERRAQIAQGLRHVMARRGYDGASIAEIARAADLTPGLVHHHFANKQEILLVVVEQLVEAHRETLEAHLAETGPDPIRQVATFIDVHLGLGATADPEALACWVLMSGEAIRQPEVRAAFEAAVTSVVQRLATIVRRGVDDGRFRCEAADEAAAGIMAAIQGYFVLAATARETIPRGSAARTVEAMATGLLQPSRPLEPRAGRG